MTGAATNQEPFGVTSEQRGHAVHLHVLGEIDVATKPILERALLTAESDGNAAILVDLEQVTFMDSSGLRVFLGAAQRASLSGRSFGVTRPPAIVQRIMQITGTNHLLSEDTVDLSPNRSVGGASETQGSGVSPSVIGLWDAP